jgi:hypothetical protein
MRISRDLRIADWHAGLSGRCGSWHLEYGRGAVVTTLPFAVVDTLLMSLDITSVRRSTVE